MTASTESIGVCSLDLEAPGLSPLPKSTRLVEAASAITLRSAVLSERDSPTRRQHPVPRILSATMDEPSDEPDQAGMRFRSDAFLYLSNEGKPVQHKRDEPTSLPLEDDASRLPSYLGISCAISGYSSYSRFCHSRENSPARVTPLKPLSFPQNNGDLKYDFSSPQFQCTKDSSVHTESVKTHRSMSSDMGLSPRDCYLNADVRRSPKESYICNRYFKSPSPEKRFVTSQNVVLSTNKSGRSKLEMTNGTSAPQSNGVHVNGHQDVDSVVNGIGRLSSQDWSKEEDGENKSLVERRIESLFGRPAAHVTQPTRMSRSKTRVVMSSDMAKRSPSCPPQAFRNTQQESPPVFRRIAPDFKEQLRNSPAPDTSCLNKPWYGPTASPLQVFTGPIPIESPIKSPKGSVIDSREAQVPVERAEPEKVAKQEEPTTDEQTPAASELSDGHRYLRILEDERALIGQHVEEATKYLSEEGLPEEALGKIRSAIGKANLLLGSKLEQFRGLCHKNINPESLPEGEFPTTTEDLAGFWDLVLIQVEDTHLTFQRIRELQRNHWKEEEKIPVPYDASSSTGAKPRRATSSGGRIRTSKSSPTTPEHKAAKPTAAREAAKAREVQRRLLLEAKRKGRQQQVRQPSPADTGDEAVEMFIPSPE